MLKKLLKNKVFQNFSYLTVGSGIAQIVSFFTVLRITKVLNPDDYGVFTFLASQGLLIMTIGGLGIRNIVIRSIARDYNRTKDLVYNGLLLRTLAVFLISLGYIFYNYQFGNLSGWQLGMVFLFSIVNCTVELLENAFLGQEKMLLPSLVSIIHSVLWFTVVFALPTDSIDPNFLFILYLVLHLIKAVIFYAFLRGKGMIYGQIRAFWASSRDLLKESWPYFVLILVMMPITKLANNFLDINSTLDEVGYYNLSQKLIGPVSLVLDLALAAIFPNLSALWTENKEKFVSYVSHGFKYFMLLGLVMCFLFSLFVGEAIDFLFPASYAPTIKVCQLRIWYLFLTSVDSFIGTLLGAANKEKVILRIGIVNSLFTTPILFFSSYYGALGLSYGYVISFAIFQFYLWYVFRKVLKINVNGTTWIWISFIILFCISYFADTIFSEHLLLFKILVSLIVVGGVGYYVCQNYKLGKII